MGTSRVAFGCDFYLSNPRNTLHCNASTSQAIMFCRLPCLQGRNRSLHHMLGFPGFPMALQAHHFSEWAHWTPGESPQRTDCHFSRCGTLPRAPTWPAQPARGQIQQVGIHPFKLHSTKNKHKGLVGGRAPCDRHAHQRLPQPIAKAHQAASAMRSAGMSARTLPSTAHATTNS